MHHIRTSGTEFCVMYIPRRPAQAFCPPLLLLVVTLPRGPWHFKQLEHNSERVGF